MDLVLNGEKNKKSLGWIAQLLGTLLTGILEMNKWFFFYFLCLFPARHLSHQQSQLIFPMPWTLTTDLLLGAAQGITRFHAQLRSWGTASCEGLLGTSLPSHLTGGLELGFLRVFPFFRLWDFVRGETCFQADFVYLEDTLSSHKEHTHTHTYKGAISRRRNMF